MRFNRRKIFKKITTGENCLLTFGIRCAIIVLSQNEGSQMTNKSIFTEVIELGIPFDNHDTDLYIPVTPQTRELIERHPESKPVLTFQNQTTPKKELWYDLAFKYIPAWAAKAGGTCLDTWEIKYRPDSAYGMSYPYEFVYLGENCILEKFPFSPYMGKFNGYSCTIGKISDSEYSLQVYKGNEQVYFKREIKTLELAYIAFCYYTHNNNK